jgi:hypothetical protein
VLSGVLHGARISLVVGLAAAGSVLIGVVVAPSPATGGGDWMPTAPTMVVGAYPRPRGSVMSSRSATSGRRSR